MNMLDGLSGLGGNALAKVLRRTIVSALIVGLGAVIIALLLSQPWAALGLAFGLGIAVLNLRFLDAGVAKLNTSGETTSLSNSSFSTSDTVVLARIRSSVPTFLTWD